jgi:uncharacterized C2H2 Zn-finger protein
MQDHEAAPPVALDLGAISPVSSPNIFRCTEEGCTSKSFKRKAELTRHMLKHEGKTQFSCLVQGCPRTGTRGFTRLDKLKDHMLAGHDEEEPFECPKPECALVFSRDLMALHASTCSNKPSMTACERIGGFRVCPMPRCSFRVYISFNRTDSALHALRDHLLEKHNSNGRFACSATLASKGFDWEDCDFHCPICGNNFSAHREFVEHFVESHLLDTCRGWISDIHRGNPFWTRDSELRELRKLWEHTPHPDLYAHRRAILAILPALQDFPIWDDIKTHGG